MISLPAILALSLIVTPTELTWPQWGGPGRSFQATASDLQEHWPETGPKLLWERKLGNGHAAIVADASMLYTAYGSAKQATVVALDARTGQTRWEFPHQVAYASFREDWDGPHATPLLSGDRLFTVAIDGQVHAFDRRTGRVLWQRDLVVEHAVSLPQSGYAASPAAWGELLLLPGLGKTGPGAIALHQEDGRTAWARHSFRSSHASPVVFSYQGRDHAVFHGMDEIVGLDPAGGDMLWRLPLRGDAADNISFTPLWDAPRQQIIVSHAYDDAGTRALRLSGEEGAWELEEVWTNRRLRVEHGNGAILEGAVYASHRGRPSFFVGIDLSTGQERFRERGIAKATLLSVDGKLLILDEEGVLSLRRASDDGLEVLARAQVLELNAWTLPTLVGNHLFLRDRFHVKALKLP